MTMNNENGLDIIYNVAYNMQEWIDGRFSIRSRGNLSLVIPNNMTLD